MRRTLSMTLLALAIGTLTLYTYRELPTRLFAADDYQWLLNVRGLSFGQLLRRAFDPGGQTHFYRPLVWVLFWAQLHAFDLDPRGYHAVSLALHLLNAGLLALLALRLLPQLRIENEELRNVSSSTDHSPHSILHTPLLVFTVSMVFVALHPAPFEAVVWISAQSELLAAALLLVALHLWLSRRPSTVDRRPTVDSASGFKWRPPMWSVVGGQWSLLATLALGLALLAKESAVIGLPLLIMIERSNVQTARPELVEGFKRSNVQRLALYHLPGLLTLGYIALQVMVERRNYLLQQGGYGVGWQIVLNPLRSLGLVVAPLAGTEHADAAWLMPVGALVALVLLAIFIRGSWGARWLVLALGLTLVPTAPFAAPPNSRYLYLPVMAAALLLGLGLDAGRKTKDERSPSHHLRPSSLVFRRVLVLGSWFLVLGSIWWAVGELHEREWRFAAGAGPGGSLWRLADSVCHERRPDRIVVVEPPIAGPVVDAIIQLSCGAKVRPMVVGRDQVSDAIKGKSVVIGFPNGSATIESTT
jgi:hypothetical protein